MEVKLSHGTAGTCYKSVHKSEYNLENERSFTINQLYHHAWKWNMNQEILPR